MTQFIVCRAEGDLRAKLWIDCELQDPPFEKMSGFNHPLQDAGQAVLFLIGTNSWLNS